MAEETTWTVWGDQQAPYFEGLTKEEMKLRVDELRQTGDDGAYGENDTTAEVYPTDGDY